MSDLLRVLAVLCCVAVVCLAYDRLELEDRLALSRFHEPQKGASTGQDAYVRYLSEFFGRPSSAAALSSGRFTRNV